MKAEKELKLRIQKKKIREKLESAQSVDETSMSRPKKSKRFSLFGRIFLITVFSLILLFLIFNINYLTPSKMKEHMKAVFADFGSGEGYPYRFSSNDVSDCFSFSSGDIAVLTNNDLIILNSSANEVLQYKHSMSNPIAMHSKDRILLYDQGAKKAVILNQSGQVLSFPNDDKIICADISDSGKSIIVTKDAAGKEVMSIYNFSGKKIMSWEKGNGYIIDCCLSANGNLAAVGIVDTEDAVQTIDVITFNVSNAKQKGSIQFKSVSLYDITFIRSSDLAVLCNNKINILDARCQLKNDVDLPSTVNKQLFCDDNAHIINAYSLYNNGKYIVDVYNTSLKKVDSKEYDGEILQVNSDGSSIVTLFSNRVAQVNMIGGKVTYRASFSIDPTFVVSKSKVVYGCSNGTIEKVRSVKQ
ncbi:MAG: hypothetical protein E7517_05675 [Ruminococcaceae bacterium]|nr:hypothetical protein [Oscillospiraceae bacterium]